MSDHASIYTRAARSIAQLSGRPVTFLLAAAIIVVWLLSLIHISEPTRPY